MSENAVPLIFALVCGGFFALVSLGGGAGLLIWGQRSRRKAQASQSWPSISGEIVQAEVRTSTTHDDEGNVEYSYYPSVTYAYSVEGKPYSSSQIAFGGTIGYNQRAKAEAKLNDYPVGKPVTVYYNPEKPSEAVLERQASGARWLSVIGGILMTIGLCISCGLLVSVVNNLTR